MFIVVLILNVDIFSDTAEQGDPRCPARFVGLGQIWFQRKKKINWLPCFRRKYMSQITGQIIQTKSRNRHAISSLYLSQFGWTDTPWVTSSRCGWPLPPTMPIRRQRMACAESGQLSCLWQVEPGNKSIRYVLSQVWIYALRAGIFIETWPTFEVRSEWGGVCDRAESVHIWLWRYVQCCLPTFSTASALRTVMQELTRLNTRPACSPVNASDMSLPTYPHDSGPMWLATPSPYRTSTCYSSPVICRFRRIPCTTAAMLYIHKLTGKMNNDRTRKDGRIRS